MCHDPGMPPAGSRITRQLAALSVVALLSGCGGDAEARWAEEPVGSALLPDFAPVPPSDIHTKQIDGAWTVEFSSTLVNVGEGDFHATADKQLDDSWVLTQDIEYDGGGAEHVTTDAQAVWGGDGHEHWHVERYVVYHLFALDEAGKVTGPARTDHKVGFCIYDFERAEVDLGSDEPTYDRKGCGEEDSTHLVMGLSPGWADHYNWDLPGQSIEIDGLADGDYRIFAVADEGTVFREETTENNETWVDFTLSSDPQGNRYALLGDVGPSPA
ncbi:lysyl oxidase family protein [Nocardioides allogilvus]|uniref:lysyl oxidase family protein n=1 Tax=Nocardioides allogilvus TaxID=2072017 RepID=UPI000D31E873|nr:lysyl oxidase family protein [Nocardioides allogilvus]